MKMTNIWRISGQPTLSFELFPPRTQQAAEDLEKTLPELVGLNPDFISVTFGAGGSTRDGSRELLDMVKNMGAEVTAYFAGYGLGPKDILSVLNAYRSMGIENLLVVRGDQPEDENFVIHPQSFAHASDLLGFIGPRYDFCLGAAGYPEGHVNAESKEKDLEYLKLKVQRGAQFIITNYFYDNEYFFNFLERCRGAGIDVPIIPGVMPIYSVKMLKMLATLCGATITEELKEGLSVVPEGDTEALVDFGVNFAVQQCAELLERGVPGLHIYTMNRSVSAAAIVTSLREQTLL
jgi:methylenetetrahydrofolate reductase (NADPH)